MQNILEDKSIKKIGQNIKFDYIILYRRGIDIEPLEDTMLMSYVLDAGKNRHNMDCLLYTSPSPRDNRVSRMPSSA